MYMLASVFSCDGEKMLAVVFINRVPGVASLAQSSGYLEPYHESPLARMEVRKSQTRYRYTLGISTKRNVDVSRASE